MNQPTTTKYSYLRRDFVLRSCFSEINKEHVISLHSTSRWWKFCLAVRQWIWMNFQNRWMREEFKKNCCIVVFFIFQPKESLSRSTCYRFKWRFPGRIRWAKLLCVSSMLWCSPRHLLTGPFWPLICTGTHLPTVVIISLHMQPHRSDRHEIIECSDPTDYTHLVCVYTDWPCMYVCAFVRACVCVCVHTQVY